MSEHSPEAFQSQIQRKVLSRRAAGRNWKDLREVPLRVLHDQQTTRKMWTGQLRI